eukprot:Nk52_evm1s2364 gene=Nk52_evmTU1s2364
MRRQDIEFDEGDEVYLDSEFVKTPLERERPNKAKLRARRIGPFPIEKKLSAVVYRLSLPPEMKIHPTFHVSRLFRKRTSDDNDFPDRTPD